MDIYFLEKAATTTDDVLSPCIDSMIKGSFLVKPGVILEVF